MLNIVCTLSYLVFRFVLEQRPTNWVGWQAEGVPGGESQGGGKAKPMNDKGINFVVVLIWRHPQGNS